MKTKRFRLLTVLLTAVMLVALSLNVMAAKSNAVTQDGLTAQLFTDKDSYKAGESVQASVQVDNNTGREVFIFTQINVPESVKLAGETNAFDTILQDGESWNTMGEIGKTMILGDISTAGGASTGDNMQAGLWIVLTILAVCGIAALFVYGKNKKTWLSIMLCMAMVAGMVVTAVPAYAADMNGDIQLSCTIQVDGKDATIDTTVSYVIYDEAEEEATATEAPADPTEAPAEPTEAPADPTEAPADPTEAPADPTEAPAEPTEPPTEEPTEVFVDLLDGIGDMETANQDKRNWKHMSAKKNHSWYDFAIGTETDPAPEGESYLRLVPNGSCSYLVKNGSACSGAASGTCTQAGSNGTYLNFVPASANSLYSANETFVLKFWVRMETEGQNNFYLSIPQAVNDSGNAGKGFPITTQEAGVWEEVTIEFVCHEDFATLGPRIYFCTDQIAGLETGGMVCIDDVRMSVKGEINPSYLAKLEWEEKLAEEQANSMMVVVDDGDPNEKLSGLTANLVADGTFDISNISLKKWYDRSRGNDNGYITAHEFVSSGGYGDNGNCLKVENTLSSRSPAIGQWVYNLIGGAEVFVQRYGKRRF